SSTPATSISLFTVGCTSGNPGDTSCFPSLASILGNPNTDSYYFDNEAANNSYFWNPSASNPTFDPSYTVNFVAADQVATPEPGTVALGMAGMAMIVALRRRRS